MSKRYAGQWSNGSLLTTAVCPGYNIAAGHSCLPLTLDLSGHPRGIAQSVSALRCRVPNTGWARANCPSPGAAATCVRKVSANEMGNRAQVRAGAGLGVAFLPSVPPVTTLSNSPLRHQGLAACQHFTLSTVQEAAGSSDAPQGARRTLDPQSKRYWLIGANPTLYAATLRKEAYRCRLNMYLFVQGMPHFPDARFSLKMIPVHVVDWRRRPLL
jgi:hypothetical protein